MMKSLGTGAMASNTTLSRAPALAPLLAAMLATGLVCACSTAPKHEFVELSPLSGSELPDLSLHNLTEVTPEMAEFVDLYIPPTMNIRERIWQLAYLAVDPYVIHFKYDPALTLPPAETFRQRRGNCLSFSLMLVAMAKYAGIPARFQEVVLEPEYNSINDTFINSRHINVVLGRGKENYVIDVSGQVYDDSVQTRTVSQGEAAAQYYNNLGVEALLDSDLPTAWVRFRQALQTNSSLAYIWSNLGVVYNRNRQIADAEAAYRTAMSINRGDSIAANNLYVIYQREGRVADAAKLENRVERHRKRNPYYLALLASEALQSAQYQDAIELLQRSIRIQGEEYRFHGALAQAQYLAGDYENAWSSLDTARALAPPAAEADLQSLPLSDFPR
jgi:Flp pilus assembly protein TadD